MKSFILLIVLMFTAPAFAQEAVLPSPEVPSEARAVGQKVGQRQIVDMVLQAANQSDMTAIQKLRLRRIMLSPFRARAREQITDRISSELIAAEMIVVTPEGVEAAIDFDAIIDFLTKLMPLIVQLISLFG